MGRLGRRGDRSPYKGGTLAATDNAGVAVRFKQHSRTRLSNILNFSYTTLEEAASSTDVQRLMAGRGAVNTLRKAMLLNGVDLMRSGGFTSIVHGDAELAHTVSAFDRSLEALQREGLA